MPRFVVIGANAAGMSAASVAKRRDPSLDVVVLEQGERISYSACGLPYWIGDEAKGPDALVSVTPEQARRERGLDLRTLTRATRVDPDARVVTTVTPQGREEAVPYDDLLLATGSEPHIPFALEALDGVFALRHIEDAEAIRTWLANERPRRAVIVGGGYVALEMTEALLDRGLEVTLVLRRRRVLGESFDPDMSDPLLEEVERRAGVLVGIAEGVLGEGGRVKAVRTQAGDVPADIVILATGVSARIDLAAQAGCALDHEAIRVDDRMRTSVPRVWAAGDCSTTWHRILQRPIFLPLALAANRQGRVVGENVTGGDARSPGVLATAVTRFFEWEVARTGATELEATVAGLRVASTTIEEVTAAGYMPKHGSMRLKIVAERGTGRLLGAQIVGTRGAGKRIDTLATAIHAGLTAQELENVDLAYAPPFSPVYDPVLIGARLAARQAAR